LFDVVVQEVHSRKNADTGIVSFYDFGKLSAPTDDDSRAMLAILSDLDPRDQRPLKFFITPGDLGKGTGVDAIGIGCYCLDKSCEGKWPQRWVLGFDNFGNDFYCYSLHKKHGVWSLLPDVL
jgi:hypothetical protein